MKFFAPAVGAWNTCSPTSWSRSAAAPPPRSPARTSRACFWDAQRAVLWSRLASRILWPIAEFDCADEHALYAGAAAIDWTGASLARAHLAIDAHVSGSGITHARYAAHRVRTPSSTPCAPAPASGPTSTSRRRTCASTWSCARRAILSIDLAGGPMHRRSWRRAQGEEAPLKETWRPRSCCAAVGRRRMPTVATCWTRCAAAARLLIEGALMVADVAWACVPAWGRATDALARVRCRAWRGLRVEAIEREARGLAALRPCLHGRDLDLARDPRCARTRAAGVETAITFEVGDIAALPADGQRARRGRL